MEYPGEWMSPMFEMYTIRKGPTEVELRQMVRIGTRGSSGAKVPVKRIHEQVCNCHRHMANCPVHNK